MNNSFNDLVNFVEQFINIERSRNKDIQYLNSSHAKLITQILSNYNLSCDTNQSNPKMIFLGAPTGAGKDILVRKIMSENNDLSFVVLNMDIFRYYHNELSNNTEFISDKDFAKKTNQTSYELYYIIQKIILEKYPSTSIIVTGTIRDLEWVKNIIQSYRNSTLSNYTISLVTLAVPTIESAFSIYERYLTLVDARDSSNTPLRYTDLEYHNDTVKKFIKNIEYFENDLLDNPDSSLIDSIRVYCRNSDIANVHENNLIYDSNNSNPSDRASTKLNEIMFSNQEISQTRINKLINIIHNNSEYLKKQNLYETIIFELKNIIPNIDL